MNKKLLIAFVLLCSCILIGYKFLKSNLDISVASKVDSSVMQNVNEIVQVNDEQEHNHEQLKNDSNAQSESSDSIIKNTDEKAVSAINSHDSDIPEEIKFEVLTLRDDDILLGNPDAKVKIVQYSSLTCPACKYYQTRVFQKLNENYIATGKIAYVAREFPFDKQAYQAAILARCGGKEKYYTFLNVLFKNQDSWAYRKNYKELLTNIGQLGGVGAEEFAKCINDPVINEIVLRNNIDASKKLKLGWAPVIFLNGLKIDNELSHNYELLSKKIDEYLDK